MTPIAWALRPIRKYSVFSGRAPRAEYWWFTVATVACDVIVGLVDQAIGASDLLWTAFSLMLTVPAIAATVRRLHDSDRTGWWVLVYIGPFIATMALGIWAGINDASLEHLTGLFVVLGLAMIGSAMAWFSFMVLPSTNGPNRYGSDPNDPAELEQVFA